ncbi:hypothetical protein HAV_00542 [Candidatus Hepatincola sp. Av]
MRKIFLLLPLCLALVSISSLQADIPIKVNEKMFLPVSTKNAINYLTSHNYVLVEELTKNKTLVLTTPNNSDVTILITSPASFSKINGVAVQVLLSKASLKPDSKKSSDSFNILTESTFQLIAKSLAFLPCANQADFLRNGFTCENTYKVQYTLYEGGMNGLRKWLGVTENKQIIINIIPLEPESASAPVTPPLTASHTTSNSSSSSSSISSSTTSSSTSNGTTSSSTSTNTNTKSDTSTINSNTSTQPTENKKAKAATTTK